MNWFQHDADSTQDAKIKKLLIRHGAVGYAVYFHCLELIIGDVCETNITFELEHDSEIIADNLKITGTGDKSGRDIVEGIMHTIVDLGLFTNENGHIFCFKLLKRINMSMTSNKGLREAIATAKDENHDEIMTHHDNIMSRHATYQPTNLPTIPTNKEEPADADHPLIPEPSVPIEAVNLASLLETLHRNGDAKYQATEKQVRTWAADIDKIQRLDGRDWKDIEAVIRWAKKPDNFWFPNIMSGKKLREKFATLWAQMKRPAQNGQRPRIAADAETGGEW